MKTIGDKIVHLRKSKLISQEQLGFELGVSTQTVYNWEKNKSEPSAKNIEALCIFFNVDSSYFFPQVITAAEEIVTGNRAEDNVKIVYVVPESRGYIAYLAAACVCYVLTLVAVFVSVCFGMIAFQPNRGIDYVSTTDIGNFEFTIAVLLAVIFLIAGIIFTICYKKGKNRYKKMNKVE